MSRSPQFVAVVTLLVVTATLLPVAVGASPSAFDVTGDEPTTNQHVPDDESTQIRIHAVPNGTDPTGLPERVGVETESDDGFVPGELLVLSIRSSTLASAVENASGETLTDRFVAAQAGKTRIEFAQVNPGTERQPYHVDLTDAANLTVVCGENSDAFRVVLDTERTVVTRGDRDAESDPRPMAELNEGVVLSARLGDVEVGDDEPPSITVLEPEATVDAHRDGGLVVTPGEVLSVTGTTTLHPAESVTVELLDGSSVAASDQVSLEPTSDGETPEERSRFAVGLDYRDASDGDTLSLRVRRNGATLSERVPVEVRTRQASLTFENDTVRTGVLVEDISLSHGGFVVLQRADGTVVDSTRFVHPFEAGINGHLYIDPELDARATFVAVAYRDANGDREFGEADVPYRRNGSPVADAAVLGPPNESRTTVPPTRTTTHPPTYPPEPTVVPSNGPPTTSSTAATPTLGMADPTEGDGENAPVPGFGVSAALAALLGVALARWR